MASRTELNRVTLADKHHRADIVLPSHTPIGHLLPDSRQLLDDRVASRTSARQLLASDGAVLLRLVRPRSTPLAPVVHDVANQVADDRDLRTSRRCPVARRATAGVATTVVTLITALLARRERWRGGPFASRTVRGLRRIVSSSAAWEVAEVVRAAERLQQTVTTGRQAATTSIRGAAGKATGHAPLGTACAHYRQDPVLFVESDPALGSLPLRLGTQPLRPSAPHDVLGRAQSLQRHVTEGRIVARTERASRA